MIEERLPTHEADLDVFPVGGQKRVQTSPEALTRHTADFRREDPSTEALKNILRQEIAKLIKRLSYRERTIIRMLYGLGGEMERGIIYTRNEIAAHLKVSLEDVARIEEKAMQKLQSARAQTDTFLTVFLSNPPEEESTPGILLKYLD